MKKIVCYLPAIIFTVLYGVAAINHIGAISPIVVVWLALFFISGFTLNKNAFWGGLLGMLPAIHLIYMGTQETGQIVSEMPIGIIVLIFYIVCSSFIFYKNKKIKKPSRCTP